MATVAVVRAIGWRRNRRPLAQRTLWGIRGSVAAVLVVVVAAFVFGDATWTLVCGFVLLVVALAWPFLLTEAQQRQVWGMRPARRR